MISTPVQFFKCCQVPVWTAILKQHLHQWTKLVSLVHFTLALIQLLYNLEQSNESLPSTLQMSWHLDGIPKQWVKRMPLSFMMGEPPYVMCKLHARKPNQHTLCTMNATQANVGETRNFQLHKHWPPICTWKRGGGWLKCMIKVADFPISLWPLSFWPFIIITRVPNFPDILANCGMASIVHTFLGNRGEAYISFNRSVRHGLVVNAKGFYVGRSRLGNGNEEEETETTDMEDGNESVESLEIWTVKKKKKKRVTTLFPPSLLSSLCNLSFHMHTRIKKDIPKHKNL